MIALKYMLIVAIIAVASVLARDLVSDFRRGVAHGNLGTYSRVERRSTFWFLILNRSLLLALISIGMIDLLFWGA